MLNSTIKAVTALKELKYISKMTARFAAECQVPTEVCSSHRNDRFQLFGVIETRISLL